MATHKNPRMQVAFTKLDNTGIKTTADLDRYIKVNPREDRFGRYLMSRSEALTELVGEYAADAILMQMAVQQCF